MNSCLELPVYPRLALPVMKAAACRLQLADGREILDLYGGHCVNTLGAGDAGLSVALARTWRELSFVTNLLDHPGRAAFLEALAPTLPPGEWRIFLANSGAEANENALKIALAASGRKRVAAFEGAFHGRTAAAAAVSDGPDPFPASPFELLRLPWGDLAAAVSELDAGFGAVILEPIQALAGVRTPPPGFLQGLRALCTRHAIPLVFDEVQTGNGRTGRFWAAQTFSVAPDLFTTAKGIAGGFPMGLTAVRAELAAALPPGLLGSTFGGGPLALAAAAEVARRLAAPGLLEGVRATSEILRRTTGCGPVKAVRGAGLLLGLVLEEGVAARNVRDALLREGILTGLCRDPSVLRLTPPLTLSPTDGTRLEEAFSTLEIPA